jgi:hypothetical protein
MEAKQKKLIITSGIVAIALVGVFMLSSGKNSYNIKKSNMFSSSSGGGGSYGYSDGRQHTNSGDTPLSNSYWTRGKFDVK